MSGSRQQEHRAAARAAEVPLLRPLLRPLLPEAAQLQRLELRLPLERRQQAQRVLLPRRVRAALGARLPQLQVGMPDVAVQLQELQCLPYRGHLQRQLQPQRRERAEPVVLRQQHRKMHTLSSSVQVEISFSRSGHRDRATGLTAQQR